MVLLEPLEQLGLTVALAPQVQQELRGPQALLVKRVLLVKLVLLVRPGLPASRV
jgi:hypothetical protein